MSWKNTDESNPGIGKVVLTFKESFDSNLNIARFDENGYNDINTGKIIQPYPIYWMEIPDESKYENNENVNEDDDEDDDDDF